MEEIKLSRVEDALAKLTYPVTRADAASELENVTLLLADGETNLGGVIEDTYSKRYESVEDLETSLFTVLPVEAVGEPFQSEGEG